MAVTRAQSANIANMLQQNVKIAINKENPDLKALTTKTNGVGLVARPVSHAGQRSALGDIRNKVSAISIDPSKKQTAIKKEIVQLSNKLQSQQSLVLNKTKATSSLKSLIETQTDYANVHLDAEEPVHKPEPKIPEVLRSMPSQPSTVSLLPVASVPECMDISDDKPEAFSKALLKVQDIDANDKENPQLVSEYVNDIYNYMRHLEEKYMVRPNYLEGQEVSGKMRAILIDWLCQVHHRFHLLQETLYLTVAIIDRFLQLCPVPRNKLQLVGVTCMLIASKYEEMYAPELADFVYITDNAYQKKDIRDMEAKILRALDFNMGKPLCLHFLRRDSKAGQVDAMKHTLAKYLMELTIVEYDMVHYNPSEIAAGALCLSMLLLDGSKWTDTLSHYSSYTEKDLMPMVHKLSTLVIKADKSKLTAVRTKYASSKFNKISTISELQSQTLIDLSTAAETAS
ncbi:G2/mitotic-specific cyclin-B-like [Ylistrum balloti]|uniref:G2/mitotic-specific cyclin-B-like n=1 Tax=Ylistrum balloti TaxID=509963 RepID=UPI002905A1FA|nr:G2/mitotic-specific cyclin-B-like [Ylistrum balloti]